MKETNNIALTSLGRKIFQGRSLASFTQADRRQLLMLATQIFEEDEDDTSSSSSLYQ